MEPPLARPWQPSNSTLRITATIRKITRAFLKQVKCILMGELCICPYCWGYVTFSHVFPSSGGRGWFFVFFVCFKTLVIEKLAGEPNILTVPEKKFNGPQVTIWLAHTATLLNPYTSLFMLPRQETTSSDTATGNEHTEIPMVEDAEIMPVRENWNSKKILSWGRASLVSLSVETFFLNTKNVRLIEMRWDGGGGEEFPPPCETTTFCLPVSDMNIFMQLSNQCYSMCYCLLCVLL